MNIIVTETANFPPNRCAACGTSQSEFFVDTGIQLEVYFNPVIYNGPGFEGAVLLCASCWENFVRTSTRMAELFRNDHNGTRTTVDSPVAEDNRDVESDDPEPASSDSESDSDGSDEESSEVSRFRAVFGPKS